MPLSTRFSHIHLHSSLGKGVNNKSNKQIHHFNMLYVMNEKQQRNKRQPNNLLIAAKTFCLGKLFCRLISHRNEKQGNSNNKNISVWTNLQRHSDCAHFDSERVKNDSQSRKCQRTETFSSKKYFNFVCIGWWMRDIEVT